MAPGTRNPRIRAPARKQPSCHTSLGIGPGKTTLRGFVQSDRWVNPMCMQLQSNVPPWLDDSEDEGRAGAQGAGPDLADVLAEIEERPEAPTEPGQTETDDALGAYLREIGRGTLLTKEQEVELAKQIGEELGLTPLEVEALRQTSRDTVSLETPIGEEGDTELGHLIEDATAESPSSAALVTDLKDQVDDVLRTLEPRERRVIQLRFGLTDGHQRALDEVARRLGTSRETVRQLERHALDKLRRTGRADALRAYSSN